MRLVQATLILVGLAGCAAGGSPSAEGPSGPSQAQLDQTCTARGGFLVPSGRPLTGQASLDYTCRVSPAEPSTRVQ